MMRFPAGADYDLVIVCNGSEIDLDNLPDLKHIGSITVVNRPNYGYNIGAWDAGFKARSDYKYYLFLQSECFIKRSNWLEAFLFRMENDSGLGIVGESLMWDGLSWEFVKLSTARDLGPDWYAPASSNPIDFYQSELDRMGIPRGRVGTHVQSLVMFVSGSTMVSTGGFPSDSRYEYAIACEIAISRKIAAQGHRVALLRPGAPFTVIGHSQWSWSGRAKSWLRHQTIGRLKRYAAPLRRFIRP